MKVLLIALFLSTSTFAANPCYKDLCIGFKVMDKFGWNGWVDGFNEETDEVMVALSHIPSVYPFPYDELGRQVLCHEGICEGEKVFNKLGEDVEVEEVFNHGKCWVFNPNRDGRFIEDVSELHHGALLHGTTII